MIEQGEMVDFRAYIVKAQQRLGIDDAEMARRCYVSIPAIQRWKQGVTVPHPASVSSIEVALS